jgi:hypothetical protein
MSTTIATAAPRQRKPRAKPARSIGLLVHPSADTAGVVRITVGKSVTDYILLAVPSDFGRGFLLTKILGEHDAYHVNLNGSESLCDCKGHEAHGHCKHVEGLAALVAAGRL